MLRTLCSLLLLCLSLATQAQTAAASGGPVDSRITEVYADQLQTLVMQHPGRRIMLERLLNERSRFQELKQTADEKYPKISSLPLFNNYNPGLQRDPVGAGFNKEHFNILKYEFPMSANHTLIYRIDGTDYILIVEPQIIKKP